MPRPKNGYVNGAGQPIPGTHDPINRFMDKTALMHWAYNRGKDGMPLYDRAAMDIGSAVHHMAELDLRGRPDREIEAYAHDCLVAPDHLRTYRKITKVQAVEATHPAPRAAHCAAEIADVEQQFVCSLLNAAIAAGNLQIQTDALVAAIKMTRAAWAQTFGAS